MKRLRLGSLGSAAKQEGVHLAEGLGLDAAVHAVPKLHLHCHLEGTLRAESFLELAERDAIAVPQRERVYRFEDFPEFLRTFVAVCKALRLPEDYARLAREFVADARAQNVVYGELFVSPSTWSHFHPELDVREALVAISRELNADGESNFSLIVDVTRNLGPESAMRTVELALATRDLGVIGIGLGGDEGRFPAELFADVFAYARGAGLHTVAHAGEAAGAESVRSAVEMLGAERIGHGVRALEDPGVVELLASKRITLEVCPTSNFRTGAASRDLPHPLFRFHEAGVPVAIDADDPALFETSIEEEYLYVARLGGLKLLRRFVRFAIEASFASKERKQALKALLREE